MSEAKAFGDRVTADTIVLKGTRDRGVQGETNAIVFFDLATGWIDCIPVKSRHTDQTVRAITQFQGPESYIKQLYTDQALSLTRPVVKSGPAMPPRRRAGLGPMASPSARSKRSLGEREFFFDKPG